MEDPIVQMITAHRDTITKRWLEAMEGIRDKHRLTTIKDDMFTTTNHEIIELMLQHASTDQALAGENNQSLVTRLQKMGMPLSYLTESLQTFRHILIETCYRELENARDLQVLYQEVDEWFAPILNQLVTVSMKSWEETVMHQRNALKELSAPLIPVFEGISVMPLVGTVDTERAKLMMENLLEGTIEHGAQVVLIDITGVPIVDTMVAHHIIQAAEAVRLVGSQCMLVGIRPEIAQTIVNLGIDLSAFPTKSTLKKGMETALAWTDRQVIDTVQEARD